MKLCIQLDIGGEFRRFQALSHFHLEETHEVVALLESHATGIAAPKMTERDVRKTYTVKGSSAASHSVVHAPPLAPSEINTVNLVKMITQASHEPNYAEAISQDMGVSAQGRQYLWNGMEVTLLEAWHYYKQDVVILHLQVHNPTSKAQYLSATQIEPYAANTKFEPLLTQQATKVLLPGQSDDKYLFLQGYALDIEDIHFELRLPATGTQLKPE